MNLVAAKAFVVLVEALAKLEAALNKPDILPGESFHFGITSPNGDDSKDIYGIMVLAPPKGAAEFRYVVFFNPDYGTVGDFKPLEVSFGCQEKNQPAIFHEKKTYVDYDNAAEAMVDYLVKSIDVKSIESAEPT